MRLISRFNPVGGVADFWHEFKRPNPCRWPILGASVLCTGVLLYAFTQEKVYVPPELPRVTYITTFAEGRSDEEIRASNIANQKRKEAAASEQAAREERVKDLYRTLGRATGIDVDAMERDIAADRAREEAAKAAEFERLTKGQTTQAGQQQQQTGGAVAERNQ